MAAAALGFMFLSSLKEEEKEKLAYISSMLSPQPKLTKCWCSKKETDLWREIRIWNIEIGI